MCKGTYKKYVLPIVYEGAVAFLKSSYFLDRLGKIEVTYKSYDCLPSILWDSQDWRKTVFGVSSMERFNVNCFFFQLLAAKILTFVWKKGASSVGLTLSRDANDNYNFEKLSVWDGFSFRSNAWGGKSIDYKQLFTK